MDKQLINQKFESLRRCVDRIESKLPGSVDTLKNDLDIQDIIALNLTRAVQVCVDVAAHWLSENGESSSPHTMGELFDALCESEVIEEDLALRLRKAVGFRNVMVHNYDEVNWDIVYSICTRHLDDFKAFACALS